MKFCFVPEDNEKQRRCWDSAGLAERLPSSGGNISPGTQRLAEGSGLLSGNHFQVGLTDKNHRIPADIYKTLCLREQAKKSPANE
jgi:hypothetical protein